MAEQKEDHLSPEEKLLRVIQGGGGKPKAPAAKAAPGTPAASPGGAPERPAAAVATAVPTPVAAAAKPVPEARASEAADKPKLKVARGASPAGGSGEGNASAKSPAASAAGAAAKPPDVAKRVHVESELSVRTLNIVLALCVLIVLFFTGREIWANVKVADTGVSIEPAPLPQEEARDEQRDLEQLDKLLDAIDVRPVFATATPKPPPPPPVEVHPPDRYCKLLGTSLNPRTGEMEAIIMDNDIKKMLYLRVGDVVASEGTPWTLEAIEADKVIFKNGEQESVVR